MVTTSGHARLNHLSCAKVEHAALAAFDDVGRELGAMDCKKILRDWFPRLLERVRERKGPDADLSDYEAEIDNVWSILNGLREAFSRNLNCNAVQHRIWAWPTEQDLRTPPKSWRGYNSPTDIDELTKDIAYYIEEPCPQHNMIDGAAINAFLFTSLVLSTDRYNTGEAYDQINWDHYLSKDNPLFALIDIQGARVAFQIFAWLEGTRSPNWRRLHDVRFDNPGLPFLRQIASAVLLWVVLPFLKWLLLPLTAAALWDMGYIKVSVVILGAWSVYLLYRIVTLPRLLRRRKQSKKKREAVFQSIEAMTTAWRYSYDRVINPSRLKELVLDAEQKGAVYPPVLHTLLDRAIQRDPTALRTRWA